MDVLGVIIDPVHPIHRPVDRVLMQVIDREGDDHEVVILGRVAVLALGLDLDLCQGSHETHWFSPRHYLSIFKEIFY